MQASKIIETLRAARDLISKPEHWTQGNFAVNADGDDVACDARAWSLIGAIDHAARMTDNDCDTYLFDCADAVVNNDEHRPLTHLTIFNANATHGDVLSVLDTAIKRLESNMRGAQ